MVQKVVSLKNVKVGDIVQAVNGTRYEITDINFPASPYDKYRIRGIELGDSSKYYRYWNADGFHIIHSDLNIVSIERKHDFSIGDEFCYPNTDIIFTIQLIIDSEHPYIIKAVSQSGTIMVQMMNEEMVDLNGHKLEPYNDDPLGFKTAKVGDVYIDGFGNELYFVAINPYSTSFPVHLHPKSSSEACAYSMDGRISATSCKLDVVRKKEVSNDSSK